MIKKPHPSLASTNATAMRDALTPEALSLLAAVHRTGSMASAAREIGVVPSALTYRIRALEDALDVLLFDRSSRRATLTAAGVELLAEGTRVLAELDAIANRVKRIATGWEPQLTIAVDSLICRTVVMQLCSDFLALNPPTRLRLRDEALSGTLACLTTGQADLALGGVLDAQSSAQLQSKLLGRVTFIYVVAPGHPLANAQEPLSEDTLRAHRAVAVADSIERGKGVSFGLAPGQDVFTVPSMADKLEAQLRGLGAGFLPDYLAAPHVQAGRLIVKAVARAPRITKVTCAWRSPSDSVPGKALQWWLKRLEAPATRCALLGANAS